MNIVKRVNNKIARTYTEKYLLRRGVRNSYIRRGLAQSLIYDWKHCGKSTKQKIWAIKRGFLPSMRDMYGLNDQNYEGFLSDIDYASIFPLNPSFQCWLDDKVTTRFVLQDSRLKDFLPKYYFYIDNAGRYSYLMDFDESLGRNADALYNILKQEKVLAMKPMAGSQGKGFIKLEFKDSEVYANDEKLNPSEFNQLKDSLKGYIVTEYCRQHSQLDKVWPDSESTLRVVVAKIKDQYGGGESKAFVSYVRFGSSLSKTTSNMSQGGLGVPFDFETGVFCDGFYWNEKFVKNGELKRDTHPDTNVRLIGEKLPNWDIVKKGLYDMADYFAPLEYFGFDVIITEDGFKICEINSMPRIVEEQIMFGPILKNPFANRFYKGKLSQVK